MSDEKDIDDIVKSFLEDDDKNRDQNENLVDEEFLNDFIQEATEHIENIEINALILEKEPGNEEVINSLFRSYHTVKGLAGFVDQDLIGKIAHQTETLLDGCRKKTIKANKNIVDIILTSSDYIKKICENISVAKDTNFLKEIESHLEVIFNAEKGIFNDITVELKPENPPKLGEILIEEKKINQEDVDKIIEKQKTEHPDLKFGQIAVKEKKVEAKDVIQATRIQQAKASISEDYMRISTDKVDSLVDMVGELVISQSLIEQFAISQLGTDNIFIANFNRMSRITKDLQNLAMFLRMVPLKSTFQKITRIARDTINELGKNIEFTTSGDETEIDRVITEKLLDPLVHLVKNAISHGIESAEDRIKAGKPPKGVIKVNAYNKRGSIYIEIIDDGGGINTERVYQKALEKGLIDTSKEYSDKEIQEFIMLPGFSTVEVANKISGRGVGMDVVKTEIQKIGGKVELNSIKGQGSSFVLKIPVNHAIMNGTVIDIEGSNYILPTINVKQILQPTSDQWIFMQGIRSMIKVREDIIPLVSIKKLFGKSREEEPVLIVIIELDQKYKALPVRNVVGRQEVVVKSVNEQFVNLGYVSGMSILGDGKVSLILDIENLFTSEGER
ncbi:MAG TPA: chemotaxis protein CheA [Candidatus Gastranaerophilales bacterium]|nr:chemotaxis protein CheA [Candidatus Gastranaerophilales bacterium]